MAEYRVESFTPREAPIRLSDRLRCTLREDNFLSLRLTDTDAEEATATMNAIITRGLNWLESGIIFAMNLLATIVFQLIMGYYSDILDQKRIMLLGMLLLLASVIFAVGRLAPRVLLRLMGRAGMLAGENLTKRPRRVTATAAVLLVCSWAAVTTSSTNFGYQGFMDEWNASENVWDLTMSGAGASSARPALSLPNSLIEKLSRRPEVAALVPERITSVDVPGGLTYDIRALDIAAFRAQGARFLWNQGDEAQAYARLIDHTRPAILLSGFAAFSGNVQPGDLLTLPTPRGPQPLEVAGTVLGASIPRMPPKPA